MFHAPHISKMSSALSTRFSPIQYRLTGTALVSNVKYSSPLLGDGWLSAGGEQEGAEECGCKLLLACRSHKAGWVCVHRVHARVFIMFRFGGGG